MYKRLTVSGLTALLFFFTPVQAQTAFIQDTVAQVEAEGYTVSSIKRSWLGRIVITAKNNTELREIVLNRASGDVLRDQKFPNEDRENRPTGLLGDGSSAKQGGQSNAGDDGGEGRDGSGNSGDGGRAGRGDSGRAGGDSPGGGGKGGPGGGKKGG